MIKNKYILLSFLLGLAILTGVGFLVPKTKISAPTPSPTPILPEPTTINKLQKLNISGIETNDFTASPIATNAQGDVEFAKTPDYEIGYLKQFNEFILNIWTPTLAARNAAENEFVNRLGITKDQACRLSVSVAQNYSSEFPGSENRKLSFCR
ncbi:MAG: hypothetical protein HYU48_02750 [Candidatus Levybacteria bacterium]|nr:hypothetical protein [Candidatus Levybacteria bacterium]